MCSETKTKNAYLLQLYKKQVSHDDTMGNIAAVLGTFFSRIFELIFLCFVVAICDLMHDVENILFSMLTASSRWESFCDI